MYFDQGKGVFVVSLDLSATFDTVDHAMLIDLMEPLYHVSGTIRKWMQSYLSEWSARVSISNELSEPWSSQFGVPQGSVLGPILFTLYLAPVSHIMKKHDVKYILYADNIQLYVPFNPHSVDSIQKSLRQISLCTSEINSWMTTMYLKLNPNKTEFMILGISNHFRDNIANVKLNINGQLISPSTTVMSLGVCIDPGLFLTDITCQSSCSHM